jgi:hypothetical protein
MRVGPHWLPKQISHSPFLYFALVVFLIVTLMIGVIHEFRIGGDLLIVLVRHAKEELTGLADVGRRLRHEFTTWDTQEPTKVQEPVPSSRPSRRS